MTESDQSPMESDSSDFEDDSTRIWKKSKKVLGWSTSEYNQLIGLVRKFGEEWEVIAKQLGNKTAKQCM
jgi:hypothetical protein